MQSTPKKCVVHRVLVQDDRDDMVFVPLPDEESDWEVISDCEKENKGDIDDASSMNKAPKVRVDVPTINVILASPVSVRSPLSVSAFSPRSVKGSPNDQSAKMFSALTSVSLKAALNSSIVASNHDNVPKGGSFRKPKTNNKKALNPKFTPKSPVRTLREKATNTPQKRAWRRPKRPVPPRPDAF
uniref:Uncharacterized protein n=1 Tax=Lotharella globosa TaxID=91324 RepID=A0A7S4DZ45_9EUKA|mmetsp:Transcript_2615/g.5182  ORF Transcript_2615/g.5182 Transcript_2615/m.5182 type:complete len:185 (+) Transcript_2615:1-555(+)